MKKCVYKNLLVILLLGFACSNNTEEDRLSPAMEAYNYNIDIMALKNPVYEENFDVNFYTNIFTDTEIFKSKSIPILENILKTEITEDLVGYFIHFKNGSSDKIPNENVEGVNMYYQTDGYLKNKYYQKEDSDFIEKFDMYEGKMSYTNLLQATQIYSKNELSDLDFKLAYDNSIDYINFKDKNDFPALYANLKHIVSKQQSTVLYKNNNGDYLNTNYTVASCQYLGHCSGPSWSDCNVQIMTCNSSGGGICENHSTAIPNQASLELELEPIELNVHLDDILNDGETNTFDFDSAVVQFVGAEQSRYNLRDKLSSNDKSQKYIDYHYALSSSLDELEFNIGTAISIIKMLPSTDDKVDIFLSDQGLNENNEISN